MRGRVVAGIGLGSATWTLVEYLLHRWSFHRRGGRLNRVVAHEHVVHHADPNRTSPAKRALGWLAVAAPSLPLRRTGSLGTGFSLGWSVGYIGYEVAHWRIHHRAPRSRRAARRRKHHLVHHFVDPRSNLGVTSRFWDTVFGTERNAPTVTATPRHLPSWALDDESGEYRSLAPRVS